MNPDFFFNSLTNHIIFNIKHTQKNKTVTDVLKGHSVNGNLELVVGSREQDSFNRILRF